jgi:HK97 family phage prohead protease
MQACGNNFSAASKSSHFSRNIEGTMKHELRNFQLRADDSSPSYILRGRAITYNSLSAPISNFRERIAPGAFTRALAAKPDVRCLFNHDANRVLGRSKNGTLALIDGKEGLDFVCQLDPNNTEHRNLYSSVKRGDIDGCSFAFAVDGDDGQEFDTDTDENGQQFSRRTIRRAQIFDISCVTNPAYPDSTSVSARAKGFTRPEPRLSIETHRAIFRNVPKGMSLEEYRDITEMAFIRARLEAIGRTIAASAPPSPAFTENEIEEVRNSIFPVRF